MPRPGTTSLRLAAVVLTFASAAATPWLGGLFVALFLYYGTPGQSPRFYFCGGLVLLAIAAGLFTGWAATAYVLFRATWSPCLESHSLRLAENSSPADSLRGTEQLPPGK